MKTKSRSSRLKKNVGMTLLELLVSVAMAGIIVSGLSSVLFQSLKIHQQVSEKNQLQQELDFAFQRIIRTTLNSRLLMLPFADNPETDWPEHQRFQTVPASAPIGSSIYATAVLAVSMPENWDLDGDGTPDADNDGDGKLDEDFPSSNTYDAAPGIKDIDDDGDGAVDENFMTTSDDDEDGIKKDDPINGIDDDGDGRIDEDPDDDMNGDGAPGIANFDDDNDGEIDEGNNADDDEDGSEDEDWLDPIVFHLNGDKLIERIPVITVSYFFGLPFPTVAHIKSTLTDKVSRFNVERLAGVEKSQLVRIELELTSEDGNIKVNAVTTLRVGAAL